MHLIKHLGLLLLFLPHFASATVTTTYCPSSVFSGIKVLNNSDSAAIACEQIQIPLEKAFNKISDISPVPLKSPFLIVRNTALKTGASYSWVETTMYMGIVNVEQLDGEIVTFYHEMGHKIYFEYFSQIMQEVVSSRPTLQKYATYMSRCESTATPPLDCRTDTSKQELKKVRESFSKDFDQFYWIDTAYNELFADVVSSLAADDKDAIAKVTGPCGNSTSVCDYRLFSKNTIDYFAGTNHYSRFSPLRRDLWDTWVVPRMTDPKSLLDALASEFTQISTSVYREDYKLVEGMMALREVNGLRAALALSQTQSPNLNAQSVNK